MSCNGCRVLRKGCRESCILRPCLQWIDSPESQGHATVFLAKFFGRAALMSFISNVPETQRPALFQSLLFEACGRTVNPVNGAVGLLGIGNWQLCQAAVQTVLQGGTLLTIPADIFIPGVHFDSPDIIDDSSDEAATCSNISILPRPAGRNLATLPELDLSLSSSFEQKKGRSSENKRRRAGSASGESGTSYDNEVGQNCNFDQLGSRSSDQVNVLELFQ